MTDQLSLIKAPVVQDLNDFLTVFNDSLTVEGSLLNNALTHIKQRGGKRMRPLLTFLITRVFQSDPDVNNTIHNNMLHAACSLELLHTASLVHDDVVDESDERRGQKSVNASFNNNVAVLVGDYILSSALNQISSTGSTDMVNILSELGMTLSKGELFQLDNLSNPDFSEDVYYDIITKKTASLFEACCHLGALVANASEDDIKEARLFGHNIGMMFQIRDDIFDYYDSSEIGKPTGNDMREGKLTLPIIYSLNSTNDDIMKTMALKVKALKATNDEIHHLVDFTKRSGGIDYAEMKMSEYHQKCLFFIEKNVDNQALKIALTAYADFVMGRSI